MKKTALHRTSIKEIFQSRTRFLSILGIIFLGVAFFAGLSATGPDMLTTANNYYEDYDLSNLKLQSTLGLTEKDLELIKKDTNVKQADPSYALDINLLKENRVVHFESYDLKQKNPINQYVVVTGRLPEKSGEIALDQIALDQGDYKIGDTFTIEDTQENRDQFATLNYKIVGGLNSPVYIENFTRGNTNVGKGSIDYFAVIPAADFTLDTYSQINVTFKNLAGESGYSEKYDDTIEKEKDKLKDLLKDRPEGRVAEIRADAADELNDAKQEIADGKQQLADTEQQLQDAKAELEQGQAELAESEQEFQQQIASGQQEIVNNRATLDASAAELAQGQAELAAQEQQLQAAQAQVEQARTALPELEQQQLSLSTTIPAIQQAVAGYAQLTTSIQELSAQQLPDPALATAIAQAGPAWQGALTELQAPSELTAVLSGLIAAPSQAGLTDFLGAVESVSAALNQQAAEAQAGLDQVNATISQLQAAISEYESGAAQLAAAKETLAAGQAQLQDGQDQLAAAEAELASAQAEGQAQIDEAAQKLADGQKEYEAGVAKYQEAQAENLPQLQDAETELAKQEKELADIKPAEYFYFDRDDNPGYAEYSENADRIASIATVFPVFFFLIAALVSLTTMTRMVEEKRGEIGTFKALGYRNWEIAQKYLLYAATASMIGAIAGLAIGYQIFPTLIFNAYGSLYNLPKVVTMWYPQYTVISTIVALLCTAGAALVVLRVDLFSTPASLLRPKAPKPGQRILLERIGPIWRRLSFIQKVTARNLFRYKLRMMMTILGIAGCMAMIITGFGLRDSISDIVTIQFDKIWHYQAIVTLNEDVTDEESKDYYTDLDDVPNFKAHMPISSETYQYVKKGINTQDVTVYVPQNPKEISEFILFNDRVSGKKFTLNDDGAIINEKLADLYEVKVGDDIPLTDSDNHTYHIKVHAIVENYTMHFAYMTPTYYQKIFEKEPNYNSDFLLFDHTPNDTEEGKVAEQLLENDSVVNVTFLTQIGSSLSDTLNSLNIVVWVLIISAGLLAFIVLYNLTNINISERIRELSTIKVLGFYDNEVTAYIYRENIVLTFLGILIGCLFGKLLHGFVLQTAEVDMVMFSPQIHWLSYIYSALITLLFSIIVMIFMHRKLKKVDMIEALKSNE